MREAKLFRNGQSQAVRLPKEFRLPGTSAYIRKLGEVVVLVPKRRPWDSLEKACAKFTSDFMKRRAQGRVEREPKFG